MDADSSGLVAHEFSLEAGSGAMIEVALAAAFDPYVEVFDKSGRRIAEGDDPAGEGSVTIVAGPLEDGTYTIRVTSAPGDETGGYVLRVGPFASEALGAPQADESPGRLIGPLMRLPREQDGVLHSGMLKDGVLIASSLPAGARAAEFAFPVSGEGAGAVDVWLFSDIDFDLFAAVYAGERVIADGASQEAYGYEHVKLEIPPGGEAVAVRAVLYENYPGSAPFQILARRTGEGAGAAMGDPGHLASSGEVRSTAYAGRLEPGVRYRAAIRPTEYGTQIWTFIVPDGARRIEIGLFDADQDLDISIEPGWAPTPQGAEHALQSATRRWNDRIAVDLDASGLPPGLYTLAVWPGGARGPAGDLEFDGAEEPGVAPYGIQLAVDEPLPPSSSYPGLTPLELAAMDGIDRARLATVWIESDFHWGSGAVISPDGLILTNYNVVSDCHPSASDTVGCLPEGPADDPWYLAGEHLVWMIDPQRGIARQRFVAEVVEVLPEADLALLRIVSDLEGRPVLPARAVPGEGEAHFPFLVVDGPGSAGRGRSPGQVVALGFPGGAWEGRVAAHALDPADVDYVSGPPDVYAIDADGPPWHSGMPVVATGQGLLLGLVTERHRMRSGEQWIMVPASLAPDRWSSEGVVPVE